MKSSKLTVNDFKPGMSVTYVPNHADSFNHPDIEHGIVSSTNDKYVFVKYVLKSGVVNETAAATDPSNLFKE